MSTQVNGQFYTAPLELCVPLVFQTQIESSDFSLFYCQFRIQYMLRFQGCTLIAHYGISGFFILIEYSYPFDLKNILKIAECRNVVDTLLSDQNCCQTSQIFWNCCQMHRSNLNKFVKKATLNSSHRSISFLYSRMQCSRRLSTRS